MNLSQRSFIYLFPGCYLEPGCGKHVWLVDLWFHSFTSEHFIVIHTNGNWSILPVCATSQDGEEVAKRVYRLLALRVVFPSSSERE